MGVQNGDNINNDLKANLRKTVLSLGTTENSKLKVATCNLVNSNLQHGGKPYNSAIHLAMQLRGRGLYRGILVIRD